MRIKIQKNDLQNKLLNLIFLILMSITVTVQTAIADILHNDDVITEGFICLSDSNRCFVNQTNHVGLVGGVSVGDIDLIVKDFFPAIALQSQTADTNWIITHNFNGGSDFKIRSQSLTESQIDRFVIEDIGTSQTQFRIDSSGQIGVNEQDPVTALDVKAISGNKAAIKVTNGGGANNAIHTILNLASNGPPSLRLRDNFNNETWQFRAKQNGGFTMNNAGTPGLELEIEKDGKVRFRNSVFVNGVLVHASSKNLKENFTALDSEKVLDDVNHLNITKWNYKRDTDSVKHIGPTAEEFFATFELGESAQGISTVDASGVALLAIQALTRKMHERDSRINQLEQKVSDLLAQQDHQIRLQEKLLTLIDQKINRSQLFNNTDKS